MWPYLLRSLGGNATDITSVYGYTGPLSWGPAADGPFLSAAWKEIVAAWGESNVVSVFTRFHPLLENARLGQLLVDPSGGALGVGGLVLGGETVSMDCKISDEAALAGYTKVLRQEVSAARRAGLRTIEDEDWRGLLDFIRLYAATMDRAGADESYFLDNSSVLRLRELLGGHLHLLVTRLDDIVAAAGLFTEYDGIVQAFFVGTEERLRSYSPLKVLLDDARRWAHLRGSSVLHLGGGRGGRDDTLFAFKRRFSPRRHQFATGRWILNIDMYQQLTEARAREGGKVTGDFFPAYRCDVDGPR
jgi:hypothetical protein